MSCSSVYIQNLRQANDGEVHRVSAEVNGAPLWFESGDEHLDPSPEAFCSALLPAAYATGKDLRIDAAVDSVWTENVESLQAVWRKWWGGRKANVRTGKTNAAKTRQAEAGGLCFSGGVDSFYTLLRSPTVFNRLVFVHGYDVSLDDRSRADAVDASLRAIASAKETEALVLRTNLREHPVYAGVDWEKSHGGALAAAGHLLGNTIGTLTISASYPYGYDRPWGSHWKTDSLWSSSQVKVLHAGAECWRADKLRDIMEENLAREHLRVCWNNLDETLNCGRCEKCLRTMLILESAGQLTSFRLFPDGHSLVEVMSELPPLSPEVLPVYRDMPRGSMSSDVIEALESLICRSQKKVPGASRSFAPCFPSLFDKLFRSGKGLGG